MVAGGIIKKKKKKEGEVKNGERFDFRSKLEF